MVEIVENICTGDVLLFSGNNFVSFLVKFFTSSKYSHVAIALRLDEKNRITLDKTKKLCVLDINLKKRYDILTGNLVSGIAIVDFEELKREYSTIDVRHLDKRFLTKSFCKNVQKFIDTHKAVDYSFSLGPIVGVWIGCPISGIKQDRKEMICSELVAYFYSYTCGTSPTVRKPNRLYRPNDFINSYSRIFQDKEETVYIRYHSIEEAIIAPLIIGLILVLLVAICLLKVNTLKK